MRIFLVRHGQSAGNVDKKLYKELSDHKVPLTDLGKQQSFEAGNFLKNYLEENPNESELKAQIYFSPFQRTKETTEHLVKGIGEDKLRLLHNGNYAREDYILKEQDFGIFDSLITDEARAEKYPIEFERYKSQGEREGAFYSKPPQGESRFDVAVRTRIFIGTIMRDFKEKKYSDLIIVAHGVTNRAFEMNFLHKSVDWMESEPNPGNCDIKLIESGAERGIYTSEYIYRSPIEFENKY